MRHKAELLFTTESCQDSLAIQKSIDEAISSVLKKENVKFSMISWSASEEEKIPVGNIQGADFFADILPVNPFTCE